MTLSSALRTAIGIGGDISRTVSLALGGLIVVLAVAVAVTRNPATTLAETVVALVGVAFLCVLGGLAVVAVFAIVRLIGIRLMPCGEPPVCRPHPVSRPSP